MDSAALRQRVAQLLAQYPWLAASLNLPPTDEPPLPPFTAHIFKLAYIAVGDADSAGVLVADVLAESPPDEAAALRTLIGRLPEGWLSWPGAAGPSEWLRLRLRREQADRLLSVLGERDPIERIALGLYLLWDIRRDDLDSWLGTEGMAERIAEMIAYCGEGLDIVTPGGDQESCAEVADDLMDANEPQLGRRVRLHTAGCDRCRMRSNGLRYMRPLLRDALNIFFRAPVPPNLVQLVAWRRRERQRWPITYAARYWRPALLVGLLLIWYMSSGRAPEASTAAELPPRDARQLLDRAINRFDEPHPPLNVLHERFQAGSGDKALLIERWYDYAAPVRLRVTVRQPRADAPIFDLGTDGTNYIAYELNDAGRTQSALVRDDNVEQLLPILRQLPFAGSFSSLPINQQDLDLSLLASARNGQPTLLGAAEWRGRAAYVVSSVIPDVGRALLTIDRQTLSLLEARVVPGAAGETATRRVWEAQQVEVVPRSEVPPGTWDLTARQSVQSMVNPRQLTLGPMTNLDINSAVAYTSLPMPERLPEQPILAYLRGNSITGSSILQLYEAKWATVAIITPRNVDDPISAYSLKERFAHGRFAFYDDFMPQVSAVQFAMDNAPERPMVLYLWHALARDDERHTMIKQILDSLVPVDLGNVAAFSNRFVAPGAIGAGTLRLQSFTRPPLPPRLRFTRAKFDRLAREDAALDPLSRLWR